MHLDKPKKLRFAPSPTGHFHLGHVLSMAFVFGYAANQKSDVLLRIEDHDQERCREEYVQSMLFDMEWLGFIPVNWNDVKTRGREAKYRQSFRKERYLQAMQQLQEKTYHCICSRQEIIRRTGELSAEEQYYDGLCKDKQHVSGAIRLALPSLDFSFDDLWQGRCEQTPKKQCGDLLIVDRLGNFTYNFAVVVDDIHDDIDTIVRGQDLLHCTGRQRILASYLGCEQEMKFLHHPLICDEEGKKLSKRFYATGLGPLREGGLKPEDVLTLALQKAKLLQDGKVISRDNLGDWMANLVALQN